MSYMSEIDLARKSGEKITRMKIASGEEKMICTTCLAMADRMFLIEHKDDCENKGINLCAGFAGKDNYGKPRSEYLTNLMSMSDEKLFDETKHKIWLSAYANNNPRSDYHWHAQACYNEWVHRGKEGRYSVAFEAAQKS